MALVVNVASLHSTCLPHHVISSNKGKPVVVGGTGTRSRVPSLRKGSHYHPIKCYREPVLPPFSGGIKDTDFAPTPDTLKKTDFPTDFLFGAATSALQTEGSGTEGGRGPSTWDLFIQDPDVPEKNVATDSYHRFKEDVKLLKDMGAKAYKFSISWSRILPDGTLKGGINEEGITFYTNLIKELRDNDIEPMVTLFHFDLPQALQIKYRGFLNRQIIADFKDYASLCFDRFGGQVKYWTTINDPQYYGTYGFSVGLDSIDPLRDPLIANHYIILAHAYAVKEFRKKKIDGEIGIPLACQWFVPHFIPDDKETAERANIFSIGWYLDPLVNGEYPDVMKRLIGNNLPTFMEEEKKVVKGSFDFIGVNYYTSRYAKNIPIVTVPKTVDDYKSVKTLVYRDGVLIGRQPPHGSTEMYIHPDGLKKVLLYMKDNYSISKFIVTGNGIPQERNDAVPVYNAVDDDFRIYFIKQHLNAVNEAMRLGVNVKGYMIWSLMDCMDVPNYYNIRYGLHFTNYKDDLKRLPKNSALWYTDFLKKT